jgi:pimeloyl-ACP methyl ester carboxylesterase
MPVIINSNSYNTDLFNGDMGRIVSGPDGPEAFFPHLERSISLAALPGFSPAYALTIHRSQGSEFDTVFVVLPRCRGSFLTRELPAISAGRYLRQRLTVPTVLLFGEGDTAITKRMLVGLEDHADDAGIEFVPDCGHFIAEDRPDVVTARALAFFRA